MPTNMSTSHLQRSWLCEHTSTSQMGLGSSGCIRVLRLSAHYQTPFLSTWMERATCTLTVFMMTSYLFYFPHHLTPQFEFIYLLTYLYLCMYAHLCLPLSPVSWGFQAHKHETFTLSLCFHQCVTWPTNQIWLPGPSAMFTLKSDPSDLNLVPSVLGPDLMQWQCTLAMTRLPCLLLLPAPSPCLVHWFMVHNFIVYEHNFWVILL